MDWLDNSAVTTDEIIYNGVSDLFAEQDGQADSQGGMDPGIIASLQQASEISVFEERPSGTDIGINVSWFSDSRSNDFVPFINQLKGARPWDDPSNLGRMTYDENGYPTSIPGYYVASSLLIRSADVEGIAPMTGEFRLYGQGGGVISLKGSAQGKLVDRVDTGRLATEVIEGETYWYVDVKFSTMGEDIALLNMLIHSFHRGDHIHDLALVHATHLDEFRDGEIFSPELIKDLQGYETLRLMNWTRANKIQEDGNGWGEEGSNWTSPDPEQRYVGTSYYTFNNNAGSKMNEGRFEVSAPIEYIVALANEVGADPWIALPVDISNSRAKEIAEYVSQHLDKDLTSRWEYGNELFNDAIGFEGYRYSISMAHKTFANFTEIGAGAAAEWAAYRGTQIYGIIRNTLEQDDVSARFVAPGWAFSASLNADGSLVENSYLARYFAAAEARKLDDSAPLPLEVVTDYSVAMYYGSTLAGRHPDVSVVHHILNTVKGSEAQAAELADWLLFGSDAKNFAELTRDQLGHPMTGVTWTRDLDIGVAPLIWADIQAGLDPLTELGTVLRLVGNVLQYRGVQAQNWTTVLVFDNVPGKTLLEMIQDVDLVGYGGKLRGVVYCGLASSLANSSTMRLASHAGYAEALGLNFVAYEGGSHLSYPVENAFAMYDAYNNSIAGAKVFARWLEIMSEGGLDEYVHFMSHDRTNGNDWWGVQDYVGQDISGEPEAIVLRKAMEAFDPDYDPETSGPLADAENVRTTETGRLVVDLPVVWKGNEAWTINADGSATESGGSIKQLVLKNLLPVAGGSSYTMTLDIGLQGSDATEVRIVARAVTGGSADLLTWRGMVSNGDTLEFDLGQIPEGLSSLYLVVQRVGVDRSGSLTISNADVDEVQPVKEGALEEEVRPLTTLDDGAWVAGAGWSLSDGEAAAMAGTTSRLTLNAPLDVKPGGRYEVSFTVMLDGADSTQLRVVGRAMGGGADEVLRWRGDVTNGQVVTLTMDQIPLYRDLLDLIVTRGGTMTGTLTLRHLMVMEVAQAADMKTLPV
ncbi:hypothetical protein LAZ40_06585 [Cereibacter sphaeroides]|uniref:hypothetical protein n=3 Tax=Cereibacter sphaeroides TaxID=1063 RepID=UPI001F3E7F8D|nr:hypothetical protein [Cereibacter sphaeroides]MCE6958713.1 hypothetical protein [Cereibacter sphaeroides]